jgi:phage terminase large subunit-like protein
VEPLVSTLNLKKPSSAYFDADAAKRAVDFFSLLPHVKGKWAGQGFKLEPWQESIVSALFGWKMSKGGPRLYRECYLEVPRKQGKSTMAAGIAGILLYADREPGAEVYCLDAQTRILYGDLTWRELEFAHVGDEIVGFDEVCVASQYRKLRPARITSLDTIVQPTYEIRMSDGRVVRASARHAWLGRTASTLRWIPTDQLAAGTRIRNLCEPWGQTQWRDAGYLAGVFDGEGYFHTPQDPRAAFRVGFAQKPGLVMDHTLKLLANHGFETTTPRLHASGVETFEIGGLEQCLRFLGQIRPERLFARAQELWANKAPSRTGYATVESVKFLGEREVVAIGTSTETLFAEGLFSHNSAAVDREQAGIVFGVLSAMVEASPELSKRSEVFRRSIVVPKTKASYKVLSADVPSKHGLNASGYVVDEVHAHPNRELIDVIATSTGSREQPLGFLITTAGVHDETSIGWEKHHYTEQVASGIVEDPSFLGIIYAAEDTDDWTSEETWAKANPGLDVTVSREYLRRECEKAKAIPAYENTFKRLHLNLWTAQTTRWISLDTWDASAGYVGDMKGRECYVGLHLASTQGCVSLVLLFPSPDGSYDVLPYFWIPEDGCASWRARGSLLGAMGQRRLRHDHAGKGDGLRRDPSAKIDELARTFQVDEIGFNPQNAIQFTNDLEDMGLELREAVPTFGTLNGATKELERAVVNRKLRHGGNPVLRYMADAAAVEINAEGNIKLSQKLSMGNISGLQALVQAMNCAIRNVEAEPSIVLI